MGRSIVKCAGIVLFGTVAAWSWVQEEKTRPGGRAPDLLILDLKVYRDEKHVTFDGRVRVGPAKKLKKITLIFDFFGPSNELLTKQHIQVTEGELEPGEEAPVHGQTISPPRAVRVKVDAEADRRQLRIDKPGPYVIE